MDPNNNIKQALAIAIVRQKRKFSKETEEWKAKAQRLEAQLKQQQTSNAQLQHWACSVLHRTTTSASTPETEDNDPSAANFTTRIFLPPLMLGHSDSFATNIPAHQSNYQTLQQQLVIAAEAGYPGPPPAAVVDVLNGKAAALSDMLLTNIQMLQKLKTVAPRCSNQDPTDPKLGSSRSSSNSPAAADTVALLGSFIRGTLLQVPSSSLRTAYMRQCASMLAALLAHPSPPAQQQPQQDQHHSTAAAPLRPATATSGTIQQQLHPGHKHNQAEAMAVQAVHLLQQLLQDKIGIRPAMSDTSGPQQQQQEPCTASVACGSATAMLQHLSTFPSTALLMALAVAQQLQQHVQQLQQANAAMASVQLCSLNSNGLDLGSRALAAAAGLFEASHELMEELDEAIVQLPTWAVALADCSWSPRALEDLVGITAAMYTACQQLQPYQPLLATAICQLCASLATRLQHVATNTDAPGMRAGSGAVLRSACGGQCLKLRDLFMPQ